MKGAFHWRAVFVASAALLACATATPLIGNYAEWAHSHWVWLDSDRSNQTSTLQFVNEWKSHVIPVGAVDIDSQWATGDNSFVPDTHKFPDMKGMISELAGMDIKTIFWMTSMVDETSPNFAEMKEKGYYIRNAFGEAQLIKWWHGKGLLLDYSNPEAKAWWEAQMDNMLEMGAAGWKTDGTDPYIEEYVEPKTSSGQVIDWPTYANWYYGHTFNYTNAKLGGDGLIMSRPVDSYDLLPGVLAGSLPFSPKYVMYSGWVGDNDPTFEGLREALRDMIRSAWLGYTNYGSDIGGYRTGPGPLGRTMELFTRWFQTGAFVPLMENGGNKEHRPWAFDAANNTGSFCTDTYRIYTAAHYELQPYLYATGIESHGIDQGVLRPAVAAPDNFNNETVTIIGLVQDDLKIDSFAFGLGSDVYVHPIVDEGRREQVVKLPGGNGSPGDSGSSRRWARFFNESRVYAGGDRDHLVPAPLNNMPAFYRLGVPLLTHVSTPYLHNGNANSTGAVTVLVHAPVCDGTTVARSLYRRNLAGANVAYSCSNGTVTVTVEPTGHDIIVLLRGVDGSSSSVSIGGLNVARTSPVVFEHEAGTPHVMAQPLPAPRSSAPSEPVAKDWFYAPASVAASGCGEVFVRAGGADKGLTVTVDNVKVAA